MVKLSKLKVILLCFYHVYPTVNVRKKPYNRFFSRYKLEFTECINIRKMNSDIEVRYTRYVKTFLQHIAAYKQNFSSEALEFDMKQFYTHPSKRKISESK